MPNRIIKESTFSSEKIAQLTDFEFRLWVGLITQADDAGRGDARPAIIKGRVFPLRDRVTAKDIDAAIHGLAAKGCVSLYEVGGKPYFLFPTWGEHQRVRDCKPRYPGPEDADIPPRVAAGCGESPQDAALIQSNPNPNPNPNPDNAQGAPELEKCGFSPALRAAVEDWLAYKRERREAYKPTGLKALLMQISSAASAHGDAAVIGVIRQSMGSGYKGITFDRLRKKGEPSPCTPAAPDPDALKQVRRLYERVAKNGA